MTFLSKSSAVRGGLSVLWLSLATVLLPSTLLAQYVDPGAVSIVWQLLVAGLFGIIFTLRQRIGYLWHVLAGRKKRATEKKIKGE
jgi:hypothetical protein